MTKEQIKKDKNSLNLSNSSSQLLPRQGWQNKQDFIKAIIKVKRSLDIAEISNLLD